MRLLVVPAALAAAVLPIIVIAPAALADARKPVAVLPVQTIDAFDQAEGLTSALKRAVNATPGYSLDDRDLPRVDILIMSLGCGDPEHPPDAPDAACEDKIADQIKADRFVWATLEKDGTNVKGAVHFYQRGRQSGSAPLSYTANLTSGADDTLVGVGKKALLAAGGGAPFVRLQVEAGHEMGDSFIDGASAGKLLAGHGDYTATVGPHKLLVKLPDGRTMASDVIVSGAGDTVVTLTPPPPPEKPIDLKIPVGFGFLIAGVGVAAGGLYGTIDIGSEKNTLATERAATHYTGSNICDNAMYTSAGNIAVTCTFIKRDILIQETLYPIGGALALTGVVLLGTSHWRNKPAHPKAALLSVVPSFGPRSAFVSFDGLLF